MAVRTKIKMWSLKNRRGKQIYAHVMLGLRSSRALQRHVLLFSDTPPCPACGIGLVRCRLLHYDQCAWICFECGHGRCVGTSADGPPSVCMVSSMRPSISPNTSCRCTRVRPSPCPIEPAAHKTSHVERSTGRTRRSNQGGLRTRALGLMAH